MSQDLVFVLSGNFTIGKGDKKELVNKLRRKGAKVGEYLNKKVNFFCVGQNPKVGQFTEAQLIGIPIVNQSFLEDWFKLGKIPSVTPKYMIENIPTKRQHICKSSSDEDIYIHELPKKRKVKITTQTQTTTTRTTTITQTIDDATKSNQHIGGSKRSRVIALEGEIGIGKSTLCSKLENSFPSKCFTYKENTNEQFLQLFYGDTSKYGFAFQWGMLKSRIYQLQLAQHAAKHPDTPPKQFYLWDRSMIGDYIFALWNHLLGGISKQEMIVYESEFGGSIAELHKIPFMKDIDCFVLLNDEPAECKKRVEE